MTAGPTSDLRLPLLRQSAAIFAIRFFPLAAMAAIGIAFSHGLPPSINGSYQRLWVYLAIFVAIACIGLPPLMLTHSAQSIDSWLRHLRKRQSYRFALWLGSLGGVLVILFSAQEAFSPWVVGAVFMVQVTVLLLETYLIIHRRFLPALLASGFYALGFCIAHYAFLQGLYSLTFLLWMIVLVGSLRATALAIFAIAQHRRLAPPSGSAMPAGVVKQWTQLGIYDVSQVAFRWIDKLIISAITGPALFSIYFNGTQDVPFMATLLSAAGNSQLQQMATGDTSTKARLHLVNVTSAMLARIVFPIFFFLLFFREEFIVFVFSEKYRASVPLFAISILVLPLRAYNYTSILQHLNRVKTINWGAVMDICIALSLAYPLFLWKGLAGMACAFVISTFVQAGYYLIKTAQLLHCSIWALIPWKAWLVMLIVFGCALIGLHEVLIRHFGLTRTLLLGFFATVGIIAIALAPLVFSTKAHV